MSGPRRRSALLSRLADRPASAQSAIVDELRSIILYGEVAARLGDSGRRGRCGVRGEPDPGPGGSDDPDR